MYSNLRAYCILIGSFYFIPQLLTGQDQKIADSLAILYHDNTISDTGKFELLKNLAFNELSDSELTLKYAEELIDLAKQEKNNYYLYHGYLQKGETLEKIGNLELALEAYLNCVEIAIKEKYKKGEGTAYMSVASVYSVLGDSSNAELYYDKSIQLLRSSNDSILLASALLNAGDHFFNMAKYEEALRYFEESGPIFKMLNYPIGTAYYLGNTAMIYATWGNDTLAMKNFKEAIPVLVDKEDFYPVSVYQIYMSDIYLRKNDMDTAFFYAHKSLKLAQKYGLKEQISQANLQLSKLYELAGETDESLIYYRNFIVYRDSVKSIAAVNQMADKRINFEIAQKQNEVDLLYQKRKNQRIISIGIAITSVLVVILALAFYRRYTYIRKTNILIEEEKNRSETLLLNILPKETAKELKQNGKVQAIKFDFVTVLFTDFKGFTKLVEHVEPKRLINSLDFYFKKFDEITTKFGLEKIKTIGDSYMCAGGLPSKSKSHVRNVIYAAKNILQLVEMEMKADDNLIHFEIRIGIHTGPVIAGIVGTKKWQYDIWGDTVNIASRMESSSEVGRVNISESTYNEIKNEFPCEYRGEIEAKNHGRLKMYYLS